MIKNIRNLTVVMIALSWGWPASAVVAADECGGVYYEADWMNISDGPGSWCNTVTGCVAYVCDDPSEGVGIIC